MNTIKARDATIDDAIVSTTAATANKKEEVDDEEVALPGFRFHPTDEELVGFYLSRKVEKKSLSIELIKQVDIYKFDPWDLPKTNGLGDKEGYFFCKRGRKYRNSIRPNRVTGSGFWKATGIDKPVYSHGGEGRDCIGLKKTLVYYRGSAGKGTKTDWMMHEFRLPTNDNNTGTTTNLPTTKVSTQEAEVWTLCRIFKRNVSNRKYTPDWRELSSHKRQAAAAHVDASSVTTCSVNSNSGENYLNFGAPLVQENLYFHDEKPIIVNHQVDQRKQLQQIEQWNVSTTTAMTSISHHHHHHQQQPPPSMTSFSNNIVSSSYGMDNFLSYGDWDELRSVVEFAFDNEHHPFSHHHHHL